MMTYGDPLSLSQGIMGIAANLPPSRSLSINDQVESSRKKSVESSTQSIFKDTGSKPQAEPITIDYTGTQGAATLGMDPMVSSASVIHELAYGRIKVGMPSRGSSTEYPLPKDGASHSLDIIV